MSRLVGADGGSDAGVGGSDQEKGTLTLIFFKGKAYLRGGCRGR